MQRLRLADVLVLALPLLAGCAPRPLYRQVEISEPDGGTDDAEVEGAPDAAGDAPAPEPIADAAVDLAAADRPALTDAPMGADEGGRETGGEAPGPKRALLVVQAPNALAADDAKLR